MFTPRVLACAISVVLLAAACQSSPQPTATPPPAATETSTPAPSATPTPPPPTATATPEPTATSVPPTPVPVRPTATPVPPAPTPTSGPDAAALGRARFGQVGCSACHGASGEGNSFAPRIANTALTFQQVLSQVRNPRGAMEAFPPSVLSDADVQNIYAFLKSLR